VSKTVLTQKSVLPLHPLVILCDLARHHEAEYASNVGKSWADAGATEAHHRAAALLMALVECLNLLDAPSAKLQERFEAYATQLSLQYKKEADE